MHAAENVYNHAIMSLFRILTGEALVGLGVGMGVPEVTTQQELRLIGVECVWTAQDMEAPAPPVKVPIAYNRAERRALKMPHTYTAWLTEPELTNSLEARQQVRELFQERQELMRMGRS